MEWSGEVNSYLYYVVGLTLFAVWFYVRYEQTYWKRNDLKTPPYHFLVGHSLPRITKEKSVWELFDGYYQTYKRSADMIGLYLLTEPSVLLFDLDLIKRVMITDFDVFTTRGVYVNEKDDPISAHLFSIGGDKWRNLRKKLSPTFTSGKMKTMFPTIVALSNNFCSSFEEIVANNPSGFMIKDVTSRFTTDVIGNCAFGIECNSLSDPQNQFRTMGDKFFRRSFVRSLSQLFMVNFPAFSNRIGLKSTPEDVSEFFTQTVVDTVKYREENKVNRKDFLDLLLKIRNDESEANQLTIQEIVSQSFIFFVAGYETSSSTMMFCLFELAKRPEIQKLAREHIVEVLKKHDGELTYECLQDMDYLDKVVYETLRKYPVVPVLNRRAQRDYSFPNSKTVLRKGTIVQIPVWSIQMDPDLYPNPEVFDPHRFDKEVMSKAHPCSFMPFGEGPRICIGLRFGMMQAKIGLVALLSKFTFSLSDETEVPVVMNKFSNILMPRNDIHLKVEKI